MTVLPLFMRFVKPSLLLGMKLSLKRLPAFGQIRTATKRVSGSRTNKNDSAGRRLGPKAYEAQFVKPGTIIMRQRGTVIHPGENVRIGTDHTIYAIEPGYVRFYRDPFHPLRKYVGVALGSKLTLPSLHFAPRIRRFGYELVTNTRRAIEVESQMSRKELLAQPVINAAKEAVETERDSRILYFSNELSLRYNISLEMTLLAAERYYKISKHVQNGMTNEQAKSQTTFDYQYQTRLKTSSGDFTKRESNNLINAYNEMVSVLDSTVNVDVDSKLYNHVDVSDLEKIRIATQEKLKSEYSRLLNSEERENVRALIRRPGVFSTAQREYLTEKYLPSVAPISIPGSVVPVCSTTEDVTVQRIFDKLTGKIKLIGRPAAVFQQD